MPRPVRLNNATDDERNAVLAEVGQLATTL
jgi:hypothetical protein